MSKLSIVQQKSKHARRNRQIVIAFFVFLGLIMFLESPLTRVRKITLTGNTSIPASRILKDTTLHLGMNLWQISQKAVQHAIVSKEPVVQAVFLTTNIVQGIVTVHVVEKRIVGIFEYNGRFYNLLDDGLIYNESPSTSGFAWPIITTTLNTDVKIGEPVNVDVIQLAHQLSSVQQGDLTLISEINVNQIGEATLFLGNGFVAQVDVNQLHDALPSVNEVVKYFASKGSPPGFIDMTGPPPFRYTPFPSKNPK